MGRRTALGTGIEVTSLRASAMARVRADQTELRLMWPRSVNRSDSLSQARFPQELIGPLSVRPHQGRARILPIVEVFIASVHVSGID